MEEDKDISGEPPEDSSPSLTKEEAERELEEAIDQNTEPENVNKDVQEPAQPKEQTEKPVAQSAGYLTQGSVKLWLERMHWNANPFTFNINPNLFVGYKNQTSRLLATIEERHKFLLVLGPTGSGKTTLAKWLINNLNGFEILYIGKPPNSAEEFVKIINSKYRRPWYAFWQQRIDSIYQVPDFLNAKLKQKHLIMLLDESHEASTEMLEWLRVLSDQVEKMSIVLLGLPNFEDELKNRLETFAKRITAKVELLSLTKEETKELIAKRIQNVGGRGEEISDNVAEEIYHYTGGFPREIIRVCDELVNNAIAKGRLHIEFDLHEKREERIQESKPVSSSIVERMTPMQKEILEFLSKRPATPGQIANSMQLEKYKSRQHAVRSINNVVKALFEDGLLERRRDEKAFVYSLSPKLATLFVKR